MVNPDKREFQKIARKHSTGMVENGKSPQRGVNDEEYNDGGNTEKSPGAAGRSLS